MRHDYYAEYFEFENNNWWFVSRRKILRALLKKYLPGADTARDILDAGCGTGINLALLAEFGRVTGVDSSEEAIRFCQMRNESQVRLASIEHLPFEEETFEVITALDVLEHIEDDRQAMRELSRVCKTGGYMLVTVPVFPSLWGDHDEINQHVRRYEPARMIQLLENNGFAIEHRSFMNTWLFPAAWVWRWWRKIRRRLIHPEAGRPARPDNMHHHPWINNLLIAIYSSELPFVTGRGLPFGLSLVVLAKKEKQPRPL